jgi:TolB-like protein
LTSEEGERRLAAIMYTDIVSYTALTQKNESATVKLLEEHRRLIRPLFVSHGGREIKTMGDGFLVEFNSALDAVLCSVAIQQVMHDAFFADGVTDEIISAVAGISALNVISRTSVVGYKGTTKKVEEIGRELKVGSILEGTFKKAGNKIRVTTQLIDVANDRHLWAQNYDRNLDDVFEVQSDVAKQVAEALRVRILAPENERIEKKPTESTEAYTLYLKGRHYWNMRYSGSVKETLESLKNALNCFEQAVAEDPRFAPGYAGQADYYLILRNNYGIEPEANLKKFKEMVGKALELDPELGEAHATKGLVLATEYSFKDAESELRKAIELKPSYGMAHYWYFLMLFWEVRWDEALEQIEKALELDPLWPQFSIGLALFYRRRRDYGKALELYRRVIELGMDAHEDIAHVYGRMKMYADMRREFAAWVELEQGSLPFARTHADFYTAYYENDTERCRDLLPELEAHFGETGFYAYDVARAYFCLGENEKGFEWLERSYSKREIWLCYIKSSQQLDGVRNDPRYLDLVKRLGLS